MLSSVMRPGEVFVNDFPLTVPFEIYGKKNDNVKVKI